ncbi:hypothetical protein VP01_1323g3, partial [Puccinia sorghi]
DLEKMSGKDKDDDQNLSLALQHHIQMLTSTRRDKEDHLRLATEEDLDALPRVQHNFNCLPLPPNAPYLLNMNEVSFDLSDDPNFGQAFGKFCEQKAHHYRLRFMGLAIENCPRACEWNGRTKAYLLDTLLNALKLGEYPQYYFGASGPDVNRLKKLLKCHLNYQRTWVSFFFSFSLRIFLFPRITYFLFSLLDVNWKHATMFLNFPLTPSSLKMNGFDLPMNHLTIPWMKTRFATFLLGKAQLKKTEYPKKAGRKPAKRLPPPDANPAILDPKVWPIKLPEDCYAPSWLMNLDPQQRLSLKTQEPIMGNFISQLNA